MAPPPAPRTCGGSDSCPDVIRTDDRAGQTCGRPHTQHRCFSRLDDAWRAEFGDEVEGPRWADLYRAGVAILDFNFDAILSSMYALSTVAEGVCYRCVLPDPGIAAAALGASEFGTLPGTMPSQALHTFTLDSGASRCFFCESATLTPLPAPVPVRLADPSRGPVVAHSSTVPPVSGGSVRLTVRSSPPLVLYELGEYRCPPGCDGHYHHSWGLYTLATKPPQVAASAEVSASGQVAASCSCRLLSHQTLLWNHYLGHPSLPCLRGMHSRLLVSGLPRSLPPLPPSLAPPCLPFVDGWQRAAPHSSSFPPTTAPLQTLHMDVKGEVVDVLIPLIRTVCLQLRERFGQDLPVLRLHCDRGGERFSQDLLREFCRGEGILQSFTLPDSPQKNGIAERRIGLVMEVARTSMIHAAAPHFLWPFATSPTLRWTGEVGDASVFRVWGSRAFVGDMSADKLSAHAVPCVLFGFVPDVPRWQFYHPTLHRVLPSQDVTFVESVPFYRLFPYRSAPPPPPPLFLALGPPPVAVGSGAARGAAFGGAEYGGAEPGGAESEGAGSGSAGPRGVEPGGAEPEGVELGGAESEGAESGGLAGPSPRLSPQQLREWLVRRAHLRSGAIGAGGTGAGGPGVPAGACGPGGTAAGSPGGARTGGTGAAGTSGVGDVGAGDPTEPGAAGAGGAGAEGAGAGGAGVGGTCTGGTGGARAGAVDPAVGGAGGTVRPRPYFVPLLQQVLGVPSSPSLTPPLQVPPPDQTQSPLLSASPLPAPAPYTEQSGGCTERREPASCHVLPVRTARRVPHSLPPPVPGTQAMALRPSSIPLRVPLPAPPKSSLPEVTDPSFESAALSALVAELIDFAAACRLDYATALVAEYESSSPPSVGGECALRTDVHEDRQEEFECLAAAVPHFASMLLAPKGDPDAPDIPTPRSYAEAITGPYSSQWQAAIGSVLG
ncbi:unnamed protein product [Closterium sp. NIES-54]